MRLPVTFENKLSSLAVHSLARESHLCAQGRRFCSGRGLVQKRTRLRCEIAHPFRKLKIFSEYIQVSGNYVQRLDGEPR